MPLKICLMKSRGTIAPFIMDDINEALSLAGHSTIVINMQAEGMYEELPPDAMRSMRERTLRTIQEFKPDFLLSYGSAGIIRTGNGKDDSNLCEDLKIPYAILLFDGPTGKNDYLKSLAASNLAHIFCWDSGYMDKLKSLGFKKLWYMPLGVNIRKFRQQTEAHSQMPSHDISFIGSINGDIIRKGFASNQGLAELQKTFMELRIGHPGIPYTSILTAVESQISAASRPGYETFKNTEVFDRFLSDTLALTDAAYRINYVQTAGQSSPTGIHVYGNAEWKEFVTEQLHFEGPSIYGAQTAAIYAGSKINLNLSCNHLIKSINQRIFDVSTAGGFVLSDYREDIEELFPEDTAAFFISPDDMQKKIEYFLGHEKERAERTRRLQEIVIKEHSWDQRIKELTDKLLG